MEIRNLLLLLSATLAGCSSLLYHPTHERHLEPSRLGLKAIDFRIPGDPPLHAWRFESSARKTQALVLQFHGNAENLTSHFASLSWLPAEGFELVAFDYRGYGETPGKPDPSGTVRDGMQAISWALEASRARGIPVILHGQSLGGIVLLRALENLQQSLPTADLARIRAVVLESTFASYQGAGSSVLSRNWLTWPLQWLSHVLLSDAEAPKLDFSRWRSVPEWIVLHGTEDESISPGLGRSLFNRLPEPRHWLPAAGAGHVQSLWMQDPHGKYPYRDRLLLHLNAAIGLLPRQKLRDLEPLELSLPFEKSRTYDVLQGPGGRFSHQGEQFYAVDFAMPEGTPVLAMRSGRVVQVIDKNTRGGPSSEMAVHSNLIRIEHADGTIAEYLHLAPHSARVREGERVARGAPIALSGSTGFVTEPHLHVRVYTPLGSVRLVFED